MYNNSSNQAVTREGGINRIRLSVEYAAGNGLLAQLRLCCLLYAVVFLFLMLALALSGKVFPAVIGMATLVTCYVAGLVVEFVICGDHDEIHR